MKYKWQKNLLVTDESRIKLFGVTVTMKLVLMIIAGCIPINFDRPICTFTHKPKQLITQPKRLTATASERSWLVCLSYIPGGLLSSSPLSKSNLACFFYLSLMVQSTTILKRKLLHWLQFLTVRKAMMYFFCLSFVIFQLSCIHFLITLLNCFLI